MQDRVSELSSELKFMKTAMNFQHVLVAVNGKQITFNALLSFFILHMSLKHR